MIVNEVKSTTFCRVALGTAQLGMSYGVANRIGRPSEDDAFALLTAGVTKGLLHFDTAAAYGDSEKVLGRMFARLGIQQKARVLSKGACATSADRSLTLQVNRTLQNLGLSRLAGWMLHDERQLAEWTPAMAEEAAGLCGEGRVESFGVSVYQLESALRALESHGFTSVQFPANPFDRRFLREPALARLVASGAAVHVRSIYLQGLGLMEPAQVPARIHRGREAVQTLIAFCAGRGLERDAFCLHYVMHRTASLDARVIIGMESTAQLERNAEVLEMAPIDPMFFDEWDELWPDDIEALILPSRWNV